MLEIGEWDFGGEEAFPGRGRELPPGEKQVGCGDPRCLRGRPHQSDLEAGVGQG